MRVLKLHGYRKGQPVCLPVGASFDPASYPQAASPKAITCRNCLRWMRWIGNVEAAGQRLAGRPVAGALARIVEDARLR